MQKINILTKGFWNDFVFVFNEPITVTTPNGSRHTLHSFDTELMVLPEGVTRGDFIRSLIEQKESESSAPTPSGGPPLTPENCAG